MSCGDSCRFYEWWTDFFADTIDIDNGLVAVGAWAKSIFFDHSGAAYVFDASTGSQIAYIVPEDGHDRDHFGISVSIDQGIVAIGAHQDGDNGFNAGSAYLFDALTGDRIDKLLASDGVAFDLFGTSVVIESGVVAVGAIGDDDNAGAACIFGSNSSVIVAEGSKLLDGVEAAGQLTDVSVSDDVYWELDPSPTQNPVKQKIHLVLQSTSLTATPGEIQFRLEAVMNGGPAGDVIQMIELMNYETGKPELVDIRPATNTDESVTITPAGNPDRFVHPLTREITAEVIWFVDEFANSPFFWDVDIDEAVWVISNPTE